MIAINITVFIAIHIIIAVGFYKVNSDFDTLGTKIDAQTTMLTAKIDAQSALLMAKMDQVIATVNKMREK